jgi:rubredoxin
MSCITSSRCRECGLILSPSKGDPQDTIKERTGFDSDCLCLTCWRQGSDKKVASWRYYCSCLGLLRHGFRIERDRNKCPYCGSTNVASVSELFKAAPNPILITCPRCKKQTMGQIWLYVTYGEEKRVKLPHRHKFIL